MKKPSTEIILDFVRDSIARLRNRGVTSPYTAQIIAEYTGAVYVIDYGVPAYRSWNARFGRFLKRHMATLAITEVASKQSYTADDGGRTTCSIWAL